MTTSKNKKNKSYGEIIKEAREKLGLSLREVAKQADISPTHLRFIEIGQRDTTPATIMKLIRVVDGPEEKALQAWLAENMPTINIREIDGINIERITITELCKAYNLADIEKLGQKTKDLRYTDVKKLTPEEIYNIVQAFNNCLSFIMELQSASKETTCLK